MKFVDWALAILVLLGLWSGSGRAYNWPLQPLAAAHPINGTLGEYRDGSHPHLHNGVDIKGNDGAPVYSIDSGIATSVTEEPMEDSYVQVGDKFYIHLDARVPSGTSVTPGEQLGVIYTGMGHVHLREGSSGPILNPLRSNGLAPYSDTSPPQVDLLEVVDDATKSAFPLDDYGYSIVTGQAEIVIKAHDVQTVGRPVVAPYWVGYEIRKDDGTVYSALRYKTRFDTLDADARLELVYDKTRSDDGNYVYWATNTQTADECWDTDWYPAGYYWIWAYVKDIKGNSVSGGEKVDDEGITASRKLRVYVDDDPAPRFTSVWAYPAGGQIEVGWHAEGEGGTKQYFVEGKRVDAWDEVGSIGYGDGLAAGVYSVRVSGGYSQYRVVALDPDGLRCESAATTISDGPPSFLDNLLADADLVVDTTRMAKAADAGCCSRLASGLAATTAGVPDWVFYGPDSLLVACGPAVDWLESKGKEVSLVGAPSPDY
jgi:hypothetical protein